MHNCNTKIKQREFQIDESTNLVEFLSNSCNILGIQINLETLKEIQRKIEDEKYKYNYYIVEKQNRIMTIHSSKGLENDNVIIILDNKYNKVNDEFKNKLFVAITRAKDNVYILCENNNEISEFISNLLQ